jgi:hypothetical protein
MNRKIWEDYFDSGAYTSDEMYEMLNIEAIKAENKELKEKLEGTEETLETIRKMDEVGLTYITKELEKAEAQLKDFESNKVAEFSGKAEFVNGVGKTVILDSENSETEIWIDFKGINGSDTYTVTISKEKEG